MSGLDGVNNISENTDVKNDIDVNMAIVEGEERVKEMNVINNLAKLDDFDFSSLEDLMSNTELVEFTIDNWSSKDKNGNYLINSEMVKSIKNLVKDFIETGSDNELKLKDNFSMDVLSSKNFSIQGTEFNGLKNDEHLRVTIKYIHGELVFKEEPNSLNSQILLGFMDKENDENENNTQGIDNKKEEILNNNINSVNNSADKQKLFEEIIRDATDLTFNGNNFESKILDDKNLTINTNFSMLGNRIDSGSIIINGSEINFNNLNDDTKLYVEKSVNKFREDLRKEMQSFKNF